MRLTERRRVRRPQPKAFSYTADFSNIEKWDPSIVASRRIGEGPLGVGSRFTLDVRFGNRVLPMTYEITSYEPYDRVVLIGKGATLDATDEINFRTEGDETVIDYKADLSFHKLLRYLAPVKSPLMKRTGRRALDGLVAALDR